MSDLKNIKAKYLWMGVAGLFLIAIGLIVGCSYADDTLNKILIVFLAIDFILLTILIQLASLKSFKYKPKLKKLPKKSYQGEINSESLKKAGFKEKSVEFGKSYLYIASDVAFKINLINDTKLYFYPTASDNSKPNKALDRCNRLIGIEIFEEPNEDTMLKLPDFSMQGDKIYYTALAHRNNSYECVNYIEPNERFNEDFLKLLKLLELEEISEIIENV